jgi:hypothetical protein
MSMHEDTWHRAPHRGLPGEALASRLPLAARCRRGVGFGLFSLLAAVSGASSVLVLHELGGHPAPLLETGSLGDEVIPRTAAASLARSVLLRLDDANRSGSYDVFRSMAAPAFQSINSAADLERIFAWLRKERIRLDMASTLGEHDIGPAAREPHGMLRVTGRVAATPRQVNFDLMFQSVGGEWRLFGIAVFRG